MTGMPTRTIDLPNAATDNSESPATAFGGAGLGAGLNQIIADAVGTGEKLGPGPGAPARGKTLVGTGTTAGDGNQESAWDSYARRNRVVGGSAQLWDQGTSPAASDNAYIGGNWRVLMEAANACTVTREASDLPTSGARWAWKLAAGSSNNNKFGLFCVLEGSSIWDLRGTVASLQAALKVAQIDDARMALCAWTGTEDATTGDPISSWGSAGTNPTLAAGWAYVNTPANLGVPTNWETFDDVIEGVSVGGSVTNLAIFIWCDDKTTTAANSYLLVTDVQLEGGAYCTGVDRRGVQEEMLRDSWFYAKTYDPTTAPGTNTATGEIFFQCSDNVNSKTVYLPVRYQRPLRGGTPTVTLYDTPGASGKIVTFDAAGAATTGVTPSTGVASSGANGFSLAHTGGVTGIGCHYTASRRI